MIPTARRAGGSGESVTRVAWAERTSIQEAVFRVLCDPLLQPAQKKPFLFLPGPHHRPSLPSRPFHRRAALRRPLRRRRANLRTRSCPVGSPGRNSRVAMVSGCAASNPETCRTPPPRSGVLVGGRRALRMLGGHSQLSAPRFGRSRLLSRPLHRRAR